MVLLLANYTIWAINQAFGLRLNKKANYLVNQGKICNCATRFNALAVTDSFSAKTL
jgi:hypothetical protein